MVPAGLRTLNSGDLPNLKDTEVALLAAKSLAGPAARLRDHIVRSLERKKS